MNDFLISILLGVVEGLTEFLPVSSTAHLRIVEALLHLDLHDGFWKMYTIVIQLGAILALPVYFRRADQRFHLHLSKRGAGRSNDLDPSFKSDADRVRRDGNSVIPLEKADREESREPRRHGLGASHRRHRHVGR